MDSVRRFIYGPSPEEQRQKCRSICRANVRKLERDITKLQDIEKKTRSSIITTAKRAQRDPSRQKEVERETRMYARELIQIRGQLDRLLTSKATLNSVSRAVDEAFSMRKVQGTIKQSVGIMKDVNSLINLPQLTGTMQELSQELMKAGIIEEMVADSMPNNDVFEDEEADAKVDEILGEVLKNKVQTPGARVPDHVPAQSQAEAEEEDLDSEEMLAQMRGRLEALKS